MTANMDEVLDALVVFQDALGHLADELTTVNAQLTESWSDLDADWQDGARVDFEGLWQPLAAEISALIGRDLPDLQHFLDERRVALEAFLEVG